MLTPLSFIYFLILRFRNLTFILTQQSRQLKLIHRKQALAKVSDGLLNFAHLLFLHTSKFQTLTRKTRLFPCAQSLSLVSEFLDFLHDLLRGLSRVLCSSAVDHRSEQSRSLACLPSHRSFVKPKGIRLRSNLSPNPQWPYCTEFKQLFLHPSVSHF